MKFCTDTDDLQQMDTNNFNWKTGFVRHFALRLNTCKTNEIIRFYLYIRAK